MGCCEKSTFELDYVIRKYMESMPGSGYDWSVWEGLCKCVCVGFFFFFLFMLYEVKDKNKNKNPFKSWL